MITLANQVFLNSEECVSKVNGISPNGSGEIYVTQLYPAYGVDEGYPLTPVYGHISLYQEEKTSDQKQKYPNETAPNQLVMNVSGTGEIDEVSIRNVADPIREKDAVNLRYLKWYINKILSGFGPGGDSDSGGDIGDSFNDNDSNVDSLSDNESSSDSNDDSDSQSTYGDNDFDSISDSESESNNDDDDDNDSFSESISISESDDMISESSDDINNPFFKINNVHLLDSETLQIEFEILDDRVVFISGSGELNDGTNIIEGWNSTNTISFTISNINSDKNIYTIESKKEGSSNFSAPYFGIVWCSVSYRSESGNLLFEEIRYNRYEWNIPIN